MAIIIDQVKTECFEMRYFRFGHGHRNLVILPGLSVQSVMGYAEQIAAAYDCFADEFTVYVFDRRLDLPNKYTICDMASDTALAIQTLGLEDLYLFGASQGGMIALQIAIQYPKLVVKLAIGSTSSNLRDAQNGVLDKWIRLAKAKDRKGLYLSFGEKLYPRAVFEQYRKALLSAAETVTEEELTRFIILAQGMTDFYITDQLHKMNCPTLAIGAYDDRVLCADMMQEIAQELKTREDFELVMYDRYGHAAFDTAPDYKEKLYHFFIK